MVIKVITKTTCPNINNGKIQKWTSMQDFSQFRAQKPQEKNTSLADLSQEKARPGKVVVYSLQN